MSVGVSKKPRRIRCSASNGRRVGGNTNAHRYRRGIPLAVRYTTSTTRRCSRSSWGRCPAGPAAAMTLREAARRQGLRLPPLPRGAAQAGSRRASPGGVSTRAPRTAPSGVVEWKWPNRYRRLKMRYERRGATFPKRSSTGSADLLGLRSTVLLGAPSLVGRFGKQVPYHPLAPFCFFVRPPTGGVWAL